MTSSRKAAALGTALTACVVAASPGALRAASADPASALPAGGSRGGIFGNSLPGSWRPFSDASPWNTPIPADAPTHPDSGIIMTLVRREASHLRLPKIYTIPVWVVDADAIRPVTVKSPKIYDTWDRDEDGVSDVGVPVTDAMWAEPTSDGHLCVVDPAKMIAWEFSRFRFPKDGTPSCTTFNIWDLTGTGVGVPYAGKRWWARGGRGSGFPIIAGLIRPEELAAGEIRHALEVSFPKNGRGEHGKTLFIPPACRSDGQNAGRQYPIMGMLFQLDPALGEREFDAWGLNREAKIVARALQKYGMYLGDTGGAMALKVQLLSPSRIVHRRLWEARFPGFYDAVARIPTDKIRVVYTGEPVPRPK